MNQKEFLKIIEKIFEKYEDFGGDYIIPEIKKYRATCRPRFINQPSINYYDDESQIYDIVEDLKRISNNELIINITPAYDNYDRFIIDIYY